LISVRIILSDVLVLHCPSFTFCFYLNVQFIEEYSIAFYTAV